MDTPKHLLAALLAFASPSIVPTAAADEISITVLGARSCKDWVKARQDEARGEMLDWVNANRDITWMLGFMSGVNATPTYNRDLLSGVNGDTVALWADKYCKAHPTEGLYEASRELAKELERIARQRNDKPKSP